MEDDKISGKVSSLFQPVWLMRFSGFSRKIRQVFVFNDETVDITKGHMVSQCRGNIGNMCETTRILSILDGHGYLRIKKIFIFLNGFEICMRPVKPSPYKRKKMYKKIIFIMCNSMCIPTPLRMDVFSI